MKINKVIENYEILKKLEVLKLDGDTATIREQINLETINITKNSDLFNAILSLLRDLEDSERLPEEDVKFDAILLVEVITREGEIIHKKVISEQNFIIRAFNAGTNEELGSLEHLSTGNIDI